MVMASTTPVSVIGPTKTRVVEVNTFWKINMLLAIEFFVRQWV